MNSKNQTKLFVLLSQQDGGIEYQICNATVTQWHDLQETFWWEVTCINTCNHKFDIIFGQVQSFFSFSLQIIMVIIYGFCFVDVHYMKVMHRIKFRIKHFYVDHVALAFIHFATCILRGLGILMLVLYLL